MKTDQTPMAGALFSSGLVEEIDWQALAPAAGGVGRFVMDLDTGLCEIDVTLRRMTGLVDRPVTFPSSEFMDLVHADDRDRIAAGIAALREANDRYDVEFRLIRPNTSDQIWVSGVGRLVRTGDGRSLLIGVNHDITDRRVAQERAELLAGEMAHRIKNVFALVKSMFNMAARTAPTRETLIEAYSGRLNALAEVNALTFAGDHRRVGLSDLVGTVLGPLIAAGQVRADLAPGFALNGTAAQTLVLSLNELLTNAVKHGALSDPAGRVDLAISVEGNDFTLDWSERTPFPVAKPEGRSGFGMRVLTSMTAATFDGSPSFDWRPGGVRFSCTWPAGQMSWHEGGRYADRVMDRAVDATSTR